MAGMADGDKPILAKHGLGFVQFVADGAMVTRIIHESGRSKVSDDWQGSASFRRRSIALARISPASVPISKCRA
jgi:hypothetical protein